MIVSPVLGSRAVFDQSLQGSPIGGALASAGVLVVGAEVLGSVVVGACGGIGGGGRRSLQTTHLTRFSQTDASNPAEAYAPIDEAATSLTRTSPNSRFGKPEGDGNA
jgi:hypothetical protein